MSDRTSVARTKEGMVRLRTPEGQEFVLTPERAIEWTSSLRFINSVRFAAIECPALDAVIDERKDPRD